MGPCSFPPQHLGICCLFFPEGSLPPPLGHLTNVYSLQVSLALRLLFKHYLSPGRGFFLLSSHSTLHVSILHSTQVVCYHDLHGFFKLDGELWVWRLKGNVISIPCT